MAAPKVLFMPAGLAAFVCCLVVTSLFSASGAIGCYYVWAYQHIEPYKSESSRAAIIAGIQGGFSILIVGESLYGLISLLSNQKGLIRWYLWLSWITFFLGCFATAGTALLIWAFHFGVRNCTTSSSGKVTCEQLQLVFKIALTIFSALGLWMLSCMPTVLRLVYSRFAAQETISNKLDFEAEEEALRSVDHEHLPLQEVPEMSTNPQADHLIKKPAVDV